MSEMSTMSDTPELAAEQSLRLTYLVVPGLSRLSTLLVNTPSGEILEFRISPKAAEQLPAFFDEKVLWERFFSSLINSLEIHNA